MRTSVYVNGDKFFTGKHCDSFHIMYPSAQEPYWQIDFVQDGKVIKRIIATGHVTVLKEFE